MKVFICLLATLTIAHAHAGHWSQGGGGGGGAGGYGYTKQHSYGAAAWNGKSKSSGYQQGSYASPYGGGGYQAAQTPPIVSHVSRSGDSTSFSIGQQGLVKPIAPAPSVPHSNGGGGGGGLYGHSHSGGLYGNSHQGGLYGKSHGGKSQYGAESYGWGAAPESNFDYTVKHPTTYGSNYGWNAQSGNSNYLSGYDAVPGTSYEHAASGAPSELYASPAGRNGWNSAGAGSYKSKSTGWWA